MEPERDIEKELKAYAQQRRAAAGSPPPLHPANRKSLQAEAARLAKSPDAPSRSWWQTLFGSWPRLVVAGAAAVAVVLGTMHLFSPPENRHEGIQSFAANRQMADVGNTRASRPGGSRPVLGENSAAEAKSSTVASDNAPSPAPGAATKSVPAAQAPVAVCRSTPTAPLAADAPSPAPGATSAPTAPPAAATPAAQTFALNAPRSRDRVPLSSSGQVDKDFGRPAPQAPAATGGALASSSDSFYRLTTADASAPLVSQRFRRTDLPSKTTKSLNASNLLASFKVEQDLGKLRIIDGDGSVYFGFVEQTPESGRQAIGLFEKKASEKESVQAKPTRPMQAFHFRVTGTNRTLKEEVVFTGNFLAQRHFAAAQAATNAVGFVESATVAPASASAFGGEPVLFELRKARVEGRLLLNGTNRLEIKAAPVKP